MKCAWLIAALLLLAPAFAHAECKTKRLGSYRNLNLSQDCGILPTPTSTPTPVATATPSATLTPTATATASPTATATSTVTPTATLTPTVTSTPTPVGTPTPTPEGGIAPACFEPDCTVNPVGPTGGPIVEGPGDCASSCECSQLVPDNGGGGSWVQYGVETFTRHGDPAGGAGAFVWLRIYDDNTCGSFTDEGPINAGGSGGDINHCWHDENRGKVFVPAGKRVGELLDLFLAPDADGNETTAIPKMFIETSEPPDFPGYSIDLGPC